MSDGNPEHALDSPSDDRVLEELQWHRVNALSPVLDTGLAFVAFVGALFSFFMQTIQEKVQDFLVTGRANLGKDLSFIQGNGLVILAVTGGILLLLALFALFSWVEWRARAYAVDDNAVYYKAGILNKQLRKARLDRVQAIDIHQRLFPRLLGMAELKFDVAGGAKSGVSIKYLTRKATEALREDMLERVRRAKGLGEGQEQASTTSAKEVIPVYHDSQDATEKLEVAQRKGAPAGSRIIAALNAGVSGVADDMGATVNAILEPYRVKSNVSADGLLLTVPAHRVVLAKLVGTESVVLLGTVLAVIVAIIVVGILVGPEALVGLVVGAISIVGALFTMVKKSLDESNFSVALTGDGLQITSGLLSTTRRVIPIDRIQAVEIKQDMLWRPLGWWNVKFNIAGAHPKDSSTLLPVGKIPDVMVLLGLVLPDPGVSVGEVTGGDVVREAMLTPASGKPVGVAAEVFVHQPVSSRWLDWWSWKANMYTFTDTLLIVRRGVINRKVIMVPHARVQSMALRTGPLQRACRVRTVQVHSTSGPVHPQIKHCAARGARKLLFDYAVRTQRARMELDGHAVDGQVARGHAVDGHAAGEN